MCKIRGARDIQVFRDLQTSPQGWTNQGLGGLGEWAEVRKGFGVGPGPEPAGLVSSLRS